MEYFKELRNERCVVRFCMKGRNSFQYILAIVRTKSEPTKKEPPRYQDAKLGKRFAYNSDLKIPLSLAQQMDLAFRSSLKVLKLKSASKTSDDMHLNHHDRCDRVRKETYHSFLWITHQRGNRQSSFHPLLYIRSIPFHHDDKETFAFMKQHSAEVAEGNSLSTSPSFHLMQSGLFMQKSTFRHDFRTYHNRF